MLKDFKPTILFLVKFFGVYLVFSLLYGLYIKGYDEQTPAHTDVITQWVTRNTAATASVLGYNSKIVEHDHLNRSSEVEQTYDSLYLNDVYAISVEEGCNGINILILFMAFVVAFGGALRKMLWFVPVGILFIHVSNISRLIFLSLLNVEWGGRAFHFFHKYGFTAVIYLSVLILWYLWVTKLSGILKSAKEKKQHVEMA